MQGDFVVLVRGNLTVDSDLVVLVQSNLIVLVQGVWMSARLSGVAFVDYPATHARFWAH
jgi:hypothetical protein